MYKVLSRLLPLEEIKKLQKSITANEVYYFSGETEILDELRRRDSLASLDSLLAYWKDEVDVHLLELKDEASSKRVTCTLAKKYYEKGMGLLFNDINLSEEYYQTMLDNLAFDIGISNATIARNLIYATPRNGGTATHFDQNINLIIQIHGEKSWWIKENHYVESPLTRHTLGGEVDPELSSYLEREFPDSVEFEQEYLLFPGSILFVPRGHWHKTFAKNDALALNFTFSVPSWADIISMALRPKIIQSPFWREIVLGLNNEDTATKKIQNFQNLIDSLKEDIQSWRAEEILGFVEYSSSKESARDE